jgi:choline dehydrogenase-like flavoprotein
MPENYHADVIVAGSGPGGAAVTRELTRQGKKVLLLESGVDHRRQSYYGTYLGALLYSQRMSLLFTKEGLNIIRPMMVGGATSMYCGSSAPPPPWLKERYGVDIDQEVSETIEELEIAPLPEELRGKASTRIAEAAQALGYNWYPLPKFIRPHVVQKLDCGAKCMLGCSCGAKWNAAEYVDEAVRSGAELKTQAKVRKVLVEDGHVVGVWGRIGARPFTAKAPVVVLAAGGIGTPRILQASGMPQAGQGMAMDTTVMVYGFIKESGIGNEPPMTWAYEDMDTGYMLSTLLDPWLLFPLINATKGLKYPFYWPRWNRTLGVMIKLKDDISGGVFSDGSISKPMTKSDSTRLKEAEEICHKILVEAGAERSTIFTSPLRGTHPSATVRIGDMLDSNLQTEVQGLYVCDASAFPEALDRPTVLTIIGMARRLGKHLNN